MNNTPRSLIRFSCETCGAKLKAKRKHADKSSTCPKCGGTTRVPNDDKSEATEEVLLAAEPVDDKSELVGQASNSPNQSSQVAVETVPPADTAAVRPISTDMWQPGKTLLDSYKVVRHLGRGGMGDVYLVRSRSTGELFAVKRILPEKTSQKRFRDAFLRELRAWTNLPEHPNLTACRFSRTVEDQLLVFAEYAEGGSLKDWIAGGKLDSLDKILDVAIQFAWGLEAAHAQGLVHQDVKPGNVLMTADGVPKVTDFGLARAAAEADGESALPGDSLGAESVLVTGSRGTAAFASPEQSNGERLSQTTDQWSWAVSVLEMFMGQRSWRLGLAAPRVLQRQFTAAAKGNTGAFRVVPPRKIAEILMRCLVRDTEKRFPSITKAVNALEDAYETATGSPYAVPRPAILEQMGTEATIERRTSTGASWEDPVEWLRKALVAAGRDPNEANRFATRRSGSRQAQALDDLIVYEETYSIYSQLLRAGHTDIEEDYAKVCHDKSQVPSAAFGRKQETRGG